MRPQAGPYDLTFALAVDYFFATIIFMKFCLTISTMAWMVKHGKDAPLKLWKWQYAFLMWLGPILDKISQGHCETAREHDRLRAEAVVGWLS